MSDNKKRKVVWSEYAACPTCSAAPGTKCLNMLRRVFKNEFIKRPHPHRTYANDAPVVRIRHVPKKVVVEEEQLPICPLCGKHVSGHSDNFFLRPANADYPAPALVHKVCY